MFVRVKRLMARLDDHWIGDLIGSVSLFALLYAGLMAGLIWGQP